MKKSLKYLLVFILLFLSIIVSIGLINSNTINEGSLTFSEEWQGKFMTINGNKIRYIQKGKGKDLLLIHGTPGSIEDWQSIIDHFSTHYRVTAFDRLGNGFSTANNYTYTIDENVELTNNVIEMLQLDSVVVAGHSYGGSTTARMACLKNDKIKSFIVVAAPLYHFGLTLDYRLIAAPIIGKGFSILASKTIASSLIKKGLEKSFGTNKHLITSNFVKTREALWSQAKVGFTTSNERKNYHKALVNNSLQYKSIHKKISFLVGENDHPLIVKDFHQMKKELPNAEFIYLTDTAHFIQFENIKALVEVISAHLEL